MIRRRKQEKKFKNNSDYADSRTSVFILSSCLESWKEADSGNVLFTEANELFWFVSLCDDSDEIWIVQVFFKGRRRPVIRGDLNIYGIHLKYSWGSLEKKHDLKSLLDVPSITGIWNTFSSQRKKFSLLFRFFTFSGYWKVKVSSGIAFKLRSLSFNWNISSTFRIENKS